MRHRLKSLGLSPETAAASYVQRTMTGAKRIIVILGKRQWLVKQTSIGSLSYANRATPIYTNENEPSISTEPRVVGKHGKPDGKKPHLNRTPCVQSRTRTNANKTGAETTPPANTETNSSESVLFLDSGF